MPLASLKEVLSKAVRGNYGIGAFNVHNLEFMQGVIRAAEEMGSPVILAIAPVSIDYAGLEILGPLALSYAKRASIPVVVHLDHGRNVDMVQRGIQAGCSSVMFDGSALPLPENIKRTREVVKVAHEAGIPAEGEIGAMGKFEDLTEGTATLEELQRLFTKPDEAKQFVEETEIDALAISVGTIHRMTGQGAMINFDRLKEIHESVRVPLVFHGCTGLRDEDYQTSCNLGVRKFNIGTKLKMEFQKGLLSEMKHGEKDPLHCLAAGACFVYEATKERIKVLNSANRG